MVVHSVSEPGMCHKKSETQQIILLAIASHETLGVFHSFQSTQSNEAKL